MATQYLVLRLVIVDRGIINTGTCNEGKHIAYYAGLVIQNQKTFNIEYLDTYNSEILLRKFFGYEYTANKSPNLHQIVVDNRQFLEANIPFISVQDLETYLEMDNIKTLPRNSANMKMMAERMKTIPF